MCPCKNPAATTSPAPGSTTMLIFFLTPHSTTSSPFIAIAPFSPLVITKSFLSFFEKLITRNHLNSIIFRLSSVFIFDT